MSDGRKSLATTDAEDNSQRSFSPFARLFPLFFRRGARATHPIDVYFSCLRFFNASRVALRDRSGRTSLVR